MSIEDRVNGDHYAITYNGDGANVINIFRGNISAAAPNTVVVNNGAGLLSQVSVLPVSNGGTGQNSFTLNNLIAGNATSSLIDTGIDYNDVLTTNNSKIVINKQLVSNTNNVIARELWVNSGAASVSTYTAAPPVAGQVLTATSATAANWQTPSASGTGKLIIPLSTSPTYATLFMQWQSLSWIAWVNADYSVYTTGKILFNPTLSGSSLLIRLYNETTATVLGSTTAAIDGPQSFNLTSLPVTNSKIVLQVQKGINDVVIPIVHNISLVLLP